MVESFECDDDKSVYVGDSAGGSTAEDWLVESEGDGWGTLVIFCWGYDVEILLNIGGCARILVNGR